MRAFPLSEPESGCSTYRLLFWLLSHKEMYTQACYVFLFTTIVRLHFVLNYGYKLHLKLNRPTSIRTTLYKSFSKDFKLNLKTLKCTFHVTQVSLKSVDS